MLIKIVWGGVNAFLFRIKFYFFTFHFLTYSFEINYKLKIMCSDLNKYIQLRF